MSFVPTPLQASAASASNDASKVNSASTADAAAAADASNPSDMDLVFKNRTFDQYWVDKASLMYKDGIAKVSLYAMFSVCFCGWDVVEIFKIDHPPDLKKGVKARMDKIRGGLSFYLSKFLFLEFLTIFYEISTYA